MATIKGRVLSVASECVPLFKTGGLADVVGALPERLFRARNMLKERLKQYALKMGYKDMRGLRRGEYGEEE